MWCFWKHGTFTEPQRQMKSTQIWYLWLVLYPSQWNTYISLVVLEILEFDKMQTVFYQQIPAANKSKIQLFLEIWFQMVQIQYQGSRPCLLHFMQSWLWWPQWLDHTYGDSYQPASLHIYQFNTFCYKHVQ